MEIERLIVDAPGLTQFEAERIARAIAGELAARGVTHDAAIDRVRVGIPAGGPVDRLARATADELLRAVERTP